MTEIDRRTLFATVGMAGAALALTGCSDSKEESGIAKGSSAKGTTGQTREFGECEVWGEEVTATSNRPFVPEYLCAAYIKFGIDEVEKTFKPIIRHAYARWTTTSNVKSVAQHILTRLKANSSTGILYPRNDFNMFTFKTQQHIVIFVDNNESIIKFNRSPLDPQDPNNRDYLKHIIRFAPYSGIYPYYDREKNHAFYDIQPLELDADLFDSTLAYHLKYYDTDYRGNRFTINAADESSHRLFAMNIHLQMRTASGTNNYVPIVLDPDTGNMGAIP